MVDLAMVVRFNILAAALRVAANLFFELSIQPDTSPHSANRQNSTF